jgi:hypothetical protein
MRHPQPVGTPGGYVEVWRTAKRPQSPPLGAHGVFPYACRVFPDAALLPAQGRGSHGAGVVLAEIVSTPADRRAPRESGEV